MTKTALFAIAGLALLVLGSSNTFARIVTYTDSNGYMSSYSVSNMGGSTMVQELYNTAPTSSTGPHMMFGPSW